MFGADQGKARRTPPFANSGMAAGFTELVLVMAMAWPKTCTMAESGGSRAKSSHARVSAPNGVEGGGTTQDFGRTGAVLNLALMSLSEE